MNSMKFFIDFEFHERIYKPLFGKPHHIIEPISMAVVCENQREFVATFNDFDFDAAWNNLWLRDNVIKPWAHVNNKDDKREVREYFKKYGQPKKEVAQQLLDWVKTQTDPASRPTESVEFYGYYCDYDWVALATMYGTMDKLPQEFPMYCKDLKQEFDRLNTTGLLKGHFDYPEAPQGHDAVADARWNYRLYTFLKGIGQQAPDSGYDVLSRSGVKQINEGPNTVERYMTVEQAAKCVVDQAIKDLSDKASDNDTRDVVCSAGFQNSTAPVFPKSKKPKPGIKNIIEENGKAVVNIRAKCVFKYSFSSDAYLVDEEPKNYRYATAAERRLLARHMVKRRKDIHAIPRQCSLRKKKVKPKQ